VSPISHKLVQPPAGGAGASPRTLQYPSRKESASVVKVSKLLHMQRNDNFPAKNRPALQITSIRRDESSRSPGYVKEESKEDEIN